jgi:hypothetical protein
MARIVLVVLLLTFQSVAVLCDLHFDANHSESNQSETSMAGRSHSDPHEHDAGECESQSARLTRLSLEPQGKLSFADHSLDSVQTSVSIGFPAAISYSALAMAGTHQFPKPAFPILRI